MILSVQIKGNPSATDDEVAGLLSDIELICPAEIHASSGKSSRSDVAADSVRKGDPVTLGAIALAAAASGGMLTKALQPGGFLTKLADVLHERIRKDVNISITTSEGEKIELTGTSKEIESLLRKHFRQGRSG
jgi:hypothetical protein